MTIFNNRELDKLFDDITNRFFDSDNISETIKAGCSSGPICYGYTITIGSDGKPVVKESMMDILNLFRYQFTPLWITQDISHPLWYPLI